MSTVDEFERRAQEAEQSPLPMFLRVGRGVVWFAYAFVVVNLVLFALAFVLRLFGASPDAGFTQWVYRNTEFAMRPFRGIFPSREFGRASVLDTSLMFGALVYLFVAMGLDALLHRMTDRLRREQETTAQARAQADAIRLQAELAERLTAHPTGSPDGIT